jgi:hypothetical protein
MTNYKTLIFISLISLIIPSCVDLFEDKHKIYGPYYVSSDPGANYQTLWYDLGDGNSIGRVMDVKKVGHIGKIIIAESQDSFYIFDSQKDNKYLNSADIIGRPKSHEQFLKLLDSLKVSDFQFDYYLDK